MCAVKIEGQQAGVPQVDTHARPELTYTDCGSWSPVSSKNLLQVFFVKLRSRLPALRHKMSMEKILKSKAYVRFFPNLFQLVGPPIFDSPWARFDRAIWDSEVAAHNVNH